MIKFFRKIRQNLLSEGNTGKYLKYAIGEIVLVVIGILIAIQVSNWNEVRKSNNKTEALFDKFEDELFYTIKNADNDISNSIKADSEIKRILGNKVTRQEYINNDSLKDLITWRITLNPELDNMDKLKEREEELDKKYNEILLLINRFGFDREREVDAMNALRFSSEQNSDYITLNFPWARLSDSLSQESAYRYFLTDENYKNRLFTHWKKGMDYATIITSYRIELLLILSKLKAIREAYTPDQFEELFENLGLKSLERIAIDKTSKQINSDDKIAKSFIITNFSKDTLFIVLKNYKGDELISGKFLPSRIAVSRATKIDLHKNEPRIVEVYKEGILIEKYKEVQYGYLILK
jgi:hypothetical protein